LGHGVGEDSEQARDHEQHAYGLQSFCTAVGLEVAAHHGILQEKQVDLERWIEVAAR